MFVIVALWFLRQQRQQEQRSDCWTLCCLLTTTKTTFTSLKAGCHLRIVVPVVCVVFQKPQSDCCAHAAACKVVPRHHISYNKVLSYRQLSCQLKPGTVSRATTAALSIALQAIPPHTNLQHTSTRTDQPVRQYLVSTSLSDLSIILCALIFTTTETTGYLTLLRLQRVQVNTFSANK